MQTRWKIQRTLARLQAELDDLKSKQLLRRLDNVSGIDLSSNDYLGLSDDPVLRAAVIHAMEQQERISSTGSRLLSGNDPLWERLEKQFAAFVGAEASLHFGSGYLANVGVLSALLTPDVTVFSDALNHASIIDGIRLSRARKVIFPHGDLDYLEQALRSTTGDNDRFIVVESVFSMDGDYAPLQDLYGLADKYDAGLIIDEAHATGVVGPNGRGLVAAHGRPDCVIASVHTCGKALASMGAFVACSDTVRQYLINQARPFVFSTALPPSIAVQTMESLGIVKDADDRRHYLQGLHEYLRSQLRSQGFDILQTQSHIVPVILGTNDRAIRIADGLVKSGFNVRAIRPPTVPSGTARLRLSLTTRITIEQLQSLVQTLTDAL